MIHNVFYHGILRANRMIVFNLLLPDHPVVASISSEVISVVGPYINSRTQFEALNLAFAILYTPELSLYFLNLYTKKDKINIQVEISLLIFSIIYMINN